MNGRGICVECEHETQPRMLCTCPNRLPNGDWLRVRVGQLYEVKSEFVANYDCSDLRKKGRKCGVLVKEKEVIEIRYPYEWHFRTEDNVYLQVSESILLRNCKLVGVIWDRVRSSNEATLEEILRLRLYDKQS